MPDRFAVALAIVFLGTMGCMWEVYLQRQPTAYIVLVFVFILCLTVPLLLGDSTGDKDN